MKCRYTLYFYKDGTRQSATDYPTKNELDQAFNDLKAKYNATEDKARDAFHQKPFVNFRYAFGNVGHKSIGIEYYEDLNAQEETELPEDLKRAGWKLVKYQGRRPS